MNYPAIVGVESGGYIEVLQPSTERAPFINRAIMRVLLICVSLFMRKNYER